MDSLNAPTQSESTSLSAADIRSLVAPMLLATLPDNAYTQLAEYVRLLYRWNGRMNLTAIRDARTMASLHIAECLRCAQLIPTEARTLMDFGSGAGLPGIPIAITRPEMNVTLAESQTKKASFLREAVRVLGLTRTDIFAGRVSDMDPTRIFDAVAMRAVDRMGDALKAMQPRVAAKGCCMILTSQAESQAVRKVSPAVLWSIEQIPYTQQRILMTGKFHTS